MLDACALERMSREELVAEATRLQAALDKEKKVSGALSEELRRTREQNLAVQSQVEQEEEYITNKLMKRLEQLKKEKQQLATEVEQEEEFLTNTLQKKLEKLIKEKVDLESRLETEQEYVVNKLCKQLEQLSGEKAKLHKEKVDLENQLEAEQEYIMNKLQKQLEKLGAEKGGLQRERAELQRAVHELSGAVDRLNRDKVQLEAAMEMEEENIVNRLQRQLEALTSSYKALEAKLEGRGLTLRDMGLAPHELPPENWASYSRSASRAGSGDLSRRSWNSMRTHSGGHGLAIAAGAGSLPSPSSASGSLGRLSGAELMAAKLGGPGSGGRSRDRPLSASAGAGAVAAAQQPQQSQQSQQQSQQSQQTSSPVPPSPSPGQLAAPTTYAAWRREPAPGERRRGALGAMHFTSAQSRSAWTEQEDELLRQAVAKFGDRAWATVANDVPGRSSKSCSDRWRNFLSPEIEHPRKSPFTEWEVAVVVQAQHRYGNNWKAISMLLPGRTNRAVKNLFVGNLKFLEVNVSLEELLEIKPEHAGGPVRGRPGIPAASGSPSSMRAASTSSAGSAWASDVTDQPLSGSPASAATHHHDRRRRGGDCADVAGQHAGRGAGRPRRRRRRHGPAPGRAVGTPTLGGRGGEALLGLAVMDEGSPALGGGGGYGRVGGVHAGAVVPGLPGGLLGDGRTPSFSAWHGLDDGGGPSSPFAAMANLAVGGGRGAVLPKAEPGTEGGGCSALPLPFPGSTWAAAGGAGPRGGGAAGAGGGGAPGLAGAGLALPDSPALAGTILQDMRSNDSAMLQQMLEQIFEDGDDVLSDSHMTRLIASPDSQAAAAAAHHGGGGGGGGGARNTASSAYNPADLGAAAHAHHAASAGGLLDGGGGAHGGGLTPRGLARSSTWPSGAWQEEPGAAAGGDAAGGQAAAGHPSGLPLPPRSASATAGALGPQPGGAPGPAGAGPDAAGGAWGWSGPGSLPGSRPASAGGAAPGQQPQHVHLLCAQLQHENLKLMQQVHSLQTRLGSGQGPLPEQLGVTIPEPSGAPAPAPTPAGGMPGAGGERAPAPAAHHPGDADLPRLPPVATRVGGSAGGAWAAGLASLGSGGLGSGGLGCGSGSLAALKAELQSSPSVLTPGQLLDGCMVDALMPDLALRALGARRPHSTAAPNPGGPARRILAPGCILSSCAAAAARLLAAMGAAARGRRKDAKEKYDFWETQPVMQFTEDGSAAGEDGPIDALKTVADVRQQPYSLPDSFTWCEVNISDEKEVAEVFTLLHANYVEDDDAMFRFSYSPAFLQWALLPPGHRKDWHVGVRVKSSGKLVAFISAIPASIRANGAAVRAVEINFLCVLKKLRSKRLAPVLIKEITRRVNLQDIWQAAYTAGVVLPRPVASCRYWHRSLNPKKLIDVGFSSLQPRMTMARTIKLYRLPPTPATPGLRPMERGDVPAVTALLNGHLAQFKLTQHFDEPEVAHWFLPRPYVIDTYVVDGGAARGGVVSVVSFYTLPSSILGHPEHTELRAAYSFYTVPGPTPLAALMGDAMTLAAGKGYDVFNALDLAANASVLKDLKFGLGDGALQYYLYNWRLAAAPLQPGELLPGLPLGLMLDERTAGAQASAFAHAGLASFPMPLSAALGGDAGQLFPHLQAVSLAPSAGADVAPSLEALLKEATEAYRAGNYVRALALCQPVSASLPGRADVLLLLGAACYQLQDYAQCIAHNDRAILIDPSLAEAHANLANALQQLGNVDMAIVYYQSALRLKPYFTDAYNNMASALVQKGLIPEAMDCYMQALRVNPALVDVHNNLGDLWRAQGALGRPAAQQCYLEALRLDVAYAPAWRGLGDLLREGGEHMQALSCYQEAVRLRPCYADAFTGMGVVLKELKRRPEAEACFDAVVRLRPGCALAHGNLAGVLYEQGKLDAAVSTYRSALAIEPAFPEAHNNLGNALREAGRYDEAIACYSTCIQLQYSKAAQAAQLAALAPPVGAGAGAGGGALAPPAASAAAAAVAAAAAGGGLLGGLAAMAASRPPAALLPPGVAARVGVAYNNLGGILKMTGQALGAIACYEQVVLLQPESPEGHANLASAYKDAARHDAAIAALQCVCDWGERRPLFARLEAEVRRDLGAGRLPSVQPFHAMAYPFSAELARAISVRYAEHCALGAARLGLPALPHPPAARLAPGQRLRVGYVSSDFGNHPLSHLMGGVFGAHAAGGRVEVFCYALSPSDGSEWRRRIEAEAEHFVDVSGWPLGDIAGRMSSDGLHVAVNLNGYTKGARNEVFALRPAPVQASYMGFPATTGAPFLPYLISDAVVSPPELAHCYSEALALMPHCYFVNDYKRAHREVLDKSRLPRRSEFGLPEDRVIFSCSNQLYKYDPDTFATWCRILHRVPDSVLWLLRFPPYGEANIRAAAAAAGVSPERIIFTDVAHKDLHIRRSGLADVFLDTPLCNAHTTGCDVLWGGCPMVTLPMERMASRVAASLAHASGLGAEMVVGSQAEYEERAVALGSDAGARGALRARLEATRLTCPLFDTERWVRDLERLLHRMWDIHCEGGGPRSFQIEAAP
ncbi:hypothetical protein HT031_005534 [Scenedesmus sp. PABB004]|nr:hypothetical protein HT031_005534 [Scenedesmus sp. PABB004]